MNLALLYRAKSLPPGKAAGEGDGDWRGRSRSCISARQTARAIVRAFDTRPEVKEQVQSIAEFLELDLKRSR